MRNRVGIQQGHDLVRGIDLRHGLQHARDLATARGQPLGQRQHVNAMLAGLLGQLVDHRPGGIAGAIDHDPHVVVGVILPEQSCQACRQERVESAHAKDDGRPGTCVVRQCRPAKAVEEADIGDQQGRLSHDQARDNPCQYVSDAFQGNDSFRRLSGCFRTYPRTLLASLGGRPPIRFWDAFSARTARLAVSSEVRIFRR